MFYLNIFSEVANFRLNRKYAEDIKILCVYAISKAWNKGFFFKLNQSGVYYDLPKTLT